MLKRKIVFVVLAVIIFCFMTIKFDSKICYGEKGVKLEQSEDVLTKGDANKKENLAERKYEVNMFALIARAIFSLIIITGVIYFILRFFLRSQRWITKQEGIIQIITTYPLAPNKYIQIVEMGNKLLVLGISEHNINLLTEIGDKEVIDFIKIQSSKEEGKLQLSFIQHLKNRLRGQKIEQTDYEEKLKFLDKQREKLRKLEL